MHHANICHVKYRGEKWICTHSVWSIINFCWCKMRIELPEFSFNTRQQVSQIKHLKWQQFWSNRFYCWFVSSLIKNKNTSTNEKWSHKNIKVWPQKADSSERFSPDRFNKKIQTYARVSVWNTHFYITSANYNTEKGD